MKYEDENVKIWIGDSQKLLKNIPDESIATIITSPPYNINKKYGKYNDKVNFEEWKELINNIVRESYRILKPNGSLFINLSPIPIGKEKEILPLPYLAYDIIKEHNFYLRNMITWTFNNMQNPTKRLSGRYENILWCVKDLTNYTFNLDDIRIPYITKNDKRLKGGKGRNPTDVWYFDRVNNMTKKKNNWNHPTIYPQDMIERIIKMSTNPGDIVLDPFLGSGTTVSAALSLDRKAVGIEIDENYYEEILGRINNIQLKIDIE